jgi:hypothetical protein
MLKRIFALLGIIAVFALGVAVALWFYPKPQQEETVTNSTVLLEKVEQVCKLVTVEGSFTELYDETNIRKFTLYMPMPSTWRFSKQAIIKVTGKVLVGYDLKDLKVTADSTNKQIILSNIPEPEILSIDHDLEYKNLTESFFNSFEPEDYTALNANAKAVLRKKAQESRLMKEASLEGNQLIRIMQFIVESGGWTLVVEQPSGPVISVDSLFQLKG